MWRAYGSLVAVFYTETCRFCCGGLLPQLALCQQMWQEALGWGSVMGLGTHYTHSAGGHLVFNSITWCSSRCQAESLPPFKLLCPMMHNWVAPPSSGKPQRAAF